jgi:hypothetical protein
MRPNCCNRDSPRRRAVCSELDSHQAADLGLSDAEQAAIGEAFASNMASLYADLTARGAYTEQQFTSVGAPSSEAGCKSLFDRLCTPASAPASLLVQIDDNKPLLSFVTYLLVRFPDTGALTPHAHAPSPQGRYPSVPLTASEHRVEATMAFTAARGEAAALSARSPCRRRARP